MKYVIFLIILASLPIVQAATVETFVSPDSSFSALSEFIGNANESLYIASYTFSSPEMTKMLLAKNAEGLDIGLIIEKSPAGGMSDYQIASLCALYVNNITVLLYDGPLRYMHAKYAIRDETDLLVTSENYGYSGFMPDADYGNRGWGIISDGEITGELLEVFIDDSTDSVPFVCPAGNYKISGWNPAGAYRPIFNSNIFTDQNVELIYSPDSLDYLLELINSAKKSIDVQQMYIYTHWGSVSGDSVESAPSPVLEALLDKARSGVFVRIMLDSTYYQMDPEKSVSNYNTIEYVNGIAENEGIPIEARAINLDSKGLSMLHNKGIIVDSERVLVSSINWNENSIMNNREVGIIIEGDAAAYYQEVFDHDWEEQVQEYGMGFGPAMASLGALVIIVLYFWKRKGF